MRILLKGFPAIFFRCHSVANRRAPGAFADEVIAWLRERDFRLNGVYNMAYDRSGRAVQADFLLRAK